MTAAFSPQRPAPLASRNIQDANGRRRWAKRHLFDEWRDTVSTVYEETRQRHIEHLLPQFAEHFERVGWSAERLREERTARLRDLVSVAVERSSWHRTRLGAVDPAMLDEDTLRELPVMSKQDLMGSFDEIVTDPAVRLADVNAHLSSLDGDAYFRGELHAVASGGSSGVRGVFVWGWDAWATVQLTALRRSLLDRISDPELVSRPPVAMIVAAENATHFTSAVSETFATGAVETHRFRVGAPLDQIVTGLNEVAGDNFATYPSMLARLVGEARDGRLTIEPRRVLTMAEPLLPEIRKAAEDTWHAPVANMWGTSEGGVNAIGCFKGPGMHLSDDLLIIEPVDEHGDPVPAGVRSHKIYLTNLFNPLLPLIRYEITDEITLDDEPCACGSSHRRIRDIQGRNDDTFHYGPGVSIHPHLFRSVLAKRSAISEYQISQTPSGARVTICATGPVDTDEIASEIAGALGRSGVPQPSVAVEFAAEIPRLATGKLKRFIPSTSTPSVRSRP
jgi:phenylacetate-coenzyme A ligase PaaK-like adenylate-forming protein